ncbi:hypothetical protein [Streptomyces sp. NRRL F-5123]|uniref:hypothetical protein n=1 Tax=Streptomyces sp. NRRL F-5123 TaxID=1463856 RepID=UPI0005B98F86|nr:hypothetical protein [Streptomyces sp. NRRL F-5123]
MAEHRSADAASGWLPRRTRPAAAVMRGRHAAAAVPTAEALAVEARLAADFASGAAPRDADLIMSHAVTFDGPQTYGAFAQVLHAAARAALAEAAARDHQEPGPSRRAGRAGGRGPADGPCLRPDRSADRALGLDRHRCKARTHALHDPAARKVQQLDRWAADGTLPPHHGQL